MPPDAGRIGGQRRPSGEHERHRDRARERLGKQHRHEERREAEQEKHQREKQRPEVAALPAQARRMTPERQRARQLRGDRFDQSPGGGVQLSDDGQARQAFARRQVPPEQCRRCQEIEGEQNQVVLRVIGHAQRLDRRHVARRARHPDQHRDEWQRAEHARRPLLQRVEEAGFSAADAQQVTPVGIDQQARRVMRRHRPDEEERQQEQDDVPPRPRRHVDEQILRLRRQPEDRKAEQHRDHDRAQHPEGQPEIEDVVPEACATA